MTRKRIFGYFLILIAAAAPICSHLDCSDGKSSKQTAADSSQKTKSGLVKNCLPKLESKAPETYKPSNSSRVEIYWDHSGTITRYWKTKGENKDDYAYAKLWSEIDRLWLPDAIKINAFKHWLVADQIEPLQKTVKVPVFQGNTNLPEAGYKMAQDFLNDSEIAATILISDMIVDAPDQKKPFICGDIQKVRFSMTPTLFGACISSAFDKNKTAVAALRGLYVGAVKLSNPLRAKLPAIDGDRKNAELRNNGVRKPLIEKAGNEEYLFIIWLAKSREIGARIKDVLVKNMASYGAEPLVILEGGEPAGLAECDYNKTDASARPLNSRIDGSCSFFCRDEGSHELKCAVKNAEKTDSFFAPEPPVYFSDEKAFKIDAKEPGFIMLKHACEAKGGCSQTGPKSKDQSFQITVKTSWKLRKDAAQKINSWLGANPYQDYSAFFNALLIPFENYPAQTIVYSASYK